MRAARRGAQDGERRARLRPRQERGLHRRHARDAALGPARADARDRSREDRAGHDEAGPAGPVDALREPADLARPPRLRREEARLRAGARSRRCARASAWSRRPWRRPRPSGWRRPTKAKAAKAAKAGQGQAPPSRGRQAKAKPRPASPPSPPPKPRHPQSTPPPPGPPPRPAHRRRPPPERMDRSRARRGPRRRRRRHRLRRAGAASSSSSARARPAPGSGASPAASSSAPRRSPQAVAREVREETGLLVEVGALAWSSSGSATTTLRHPRLRSRVIGGALAPGGDACAGPASSSHDELGALPLTEGSSTSSRAPVLHTPRGSPPPADPVRRARGRRRPGAPRSRPGRPRRGDVPDAQWLDWRWQLSRMLTTAEEPPR